MTIKEEVSTFRKSGVKTLIKALRELPRFIKEFYGEQWLGYAGMEGRITLKQTLWLWVIIWLR